MKNLITSALILAGLAFSSVASVQTITVSNGNDSGSGSLRAALSSSPSIIHINSNVTTIRITETLNHDSVNTFKIIGSGQTIDASELPENDDILSVNEGATFSIENLNFIGNLDEINEDPSDPTGGTGIFVNVPNERTGTVAVTLDDVSVTRVGSHGIHISDCTVRDVCAPDEGSTASVSVTVNNLTINRVGLGLQDGDGLRVDERGEGNISFIANNSTFINVGADGVELDEGDNGDISATIDNSLFDGNGEYCDFASEVEDTPCDNDGDPDLDDGFDIDEAGSGSILVTITNSTFTNNFDEGLDFDEEDNGDIIMNVSNSFFSNNEDQGIRASEDNSGNVEAIFTNITLADNNQDDEAIRIEEENSGDLVVRILDSNVINSDEEGLRIDESGSGRGSLEIQNANFTDFDLDNVDRR